MNYDITRIFDELSQEIFYGFNMRMILNQMGEDELTVLIELITACRAGRKAPRLAIRHFCMKPQLVLSWEEWHSGGGCMVWMHEFCDGTSIHVTDEVIQLSKYNIQNTLDAGFDGEHEEEDYITMTHYLTEEHPETLSFYLCPFLGQELADMVAKDIEEIIRCW